MLAPRIRASTVVADVFGKIGARSEAGIPVAHASVNPEAEVRLRPHSISSRVDVFAFVEFRTSMLTSRRDLLDPTAVQARSLAQAYSRLCPAFK